MSKIPVFRTPFNYDRDAASAECGLLCEDVSLAIQSAKDESDINTIVKRFGLTGQVPQGVRMPTYEDFSEVVDFQSAMNAIGAARESFDAMPAEVRSRFNNDPGLFVDFCSDARNRDEAVRLGLVEAERTPGKPVEPAATRPAPVASPGGVEIPTVEKPGALTEG